MWIQQVALRISCDPDVRSLNRTIARQVRNPHEEVLRRWPCRDEKSAMSEHLHLPTLLVPAADAVQDGYERAHRHHHSEASMPTVVPSVAGPLNMRRSLDQAAAAVAA